MFAVTSYCLTHTTFSHLPYNLINEHTPVRDQLCSLYMLGVSHWDYMSSLHITQGVIMVKRKTLKGGNNPAGHRKHLCLCLIFPDILPLQITNPPSPSKCCTVLSISFDLQR